MLCTVHAIRRAIGLEKHKIIPSNCCRPAEHGLESTCILLSSHGCGSDSMSMFAQVLLLHILVRNSILFEAKRVFLFSHIGHYSLR